MAIKISIKFPMNINYIRKHCIFYNDRVEHNKWQNREKILANSQQMKKIILNLLKRCLTNKSLDTCKHKSVKIKLIGFSRNLSVISFLESKGFNFNFEYIQLH